MIYFRTVSVFCLFLLQSVAMANSGLWNEISTANKAAIAGPNVKQRLYQADTQELTRVLSRAVIEGRSRPSTTIQLPVANGEIQLFSVEESPIMAAGLAAKYPDIKTYKVQGLDDPHSSGRLSISAKGFHAMITGPSGTFYIDPESEGIYSAYRKNNQQPAEPFNCGVASHTHESPLGNVASRPATRSAGNLRVYRLAVAATSEYISAVGGTAQKANDEIIVAINRVNQIYQRDLAIKLELVANNDELLETFNQLPVAYSNFNELTMLDQNQLNIDSVIGTSNYDIGHVFGTGGGGIAEVGSVCTELKAGGATGLFNPTGDAFYIDYVAHEMGHQFSAEHSFNGTEVNCADPNRWQPSAFEPGSGSTIMSYAGICGDENIVTHAEAMFHAGSIQQVDNFTTTGSGADCGAPESILNPNEPLVNAGSDYTIPHKTPFKLSAEGSDADNDPVTFAWDQMDAGQATTSFSIGTDLGNNSLFRSYLPQVENFRNFPALGTTLQKKYDQSENLACKTRNLNFRVTVRDGNSGMDRDDVKISVDNASGPFQILSFNLSHSLSTGSNSIQWDVANTDKTPVNCSSVDISLLTFNASKTSYFETPLVQNEANDGSATINVPDISSSLARFKVQCSDNIFYDISDSDLMISGNTVASTTGNTVSYNSDGLLVSVLPNEICESIITDDDSAGGSMKLFWLISLFSIFTLRKMLKTKKISISCF